MENYRVLRTFRPESLLLEYLVREKRAPFEKRKLTYPQSTIDLAMHSLINDKKMYDPRNPDIVMCDSKMQSITGREAFSRFQIRGIIESHLVPRQDTDPMGDSWQCEAELEAIVKNYPPKPIHLRTPQFEIQSDTLCLVDPKFLEVLRSEAKPESTFVLGPVTSYRDVCNATSNYILSKKDKFINLSNITIALVKGDPISDVFNVSAFSRSQISALIKTKVKPVRRSKRLNKH